MKLLKLKYLFGVLYSFVLSSTVFAQVANTGAGYSSNMQLPAQVGYYQAQGQTQGVSGAVGASKSTYGTVVQGLPVRARRVVNYDLAPTMSDSLYSEVNGYKSPNRYTLAGAKRFGNASGTAGEDDKGRFEATTDEYETEYYLSLAYGFGKFKGKGLVNNDNIDFPPVNEEDNFLGNPKALTLGFGVMYNRGLSLSVEYTHLSGLNYGDYSYSSNQWCGFDEGDGKEFFFDCTDQNQVRGGGIKSSAVMFNVKFIMSDFVKGTLFDGLFVPYISAGVGVAFNTVDDFDVVDELGPSAELPTTTNGDLVDSEGLDATGMFQDNGLISHFGATKNSAAYNVEIGLSFNLDRKTMLDVYFRHVDHGDIETQDLVYYNYDEYEFVDAIAGSDGTPTCSEAALNEGFEYDEDSGYCVSEPVTVEGFESGVKEKGKIAYNEAGVRLMMVF